MAEYYINIECWLWWVFGWAGMSGMAGMTGMTGMSGMTGMAGGGGPIGIYSKFKIGGVTLNLLQSFNHT